MDNDPLGHSLMHHFSQANPLGEQGQDDVPALLRRVADSIEKLDGAEVFDLVLHNEINEHGDWYSVVVYYAMPDDPPSPGALRSV
jgi:hypothetical protein